MDVPSLHRKRLTTAPKVNKVSGQNTENKGLKDRAIGQGFGDGVSGSTGHEGVDHDGEHQARDEHDAKDQDTLVGKTCHSPQDGWGILWGHGSVF